uniref:Acyl-CoA-binding domain-containing protein 5 n=1 Tax=Tetraodon nigroviridis TaxID=99883 RepID=H3D805_TETNG
MEVECVAVEDERRLAELRFDAAVKVIKSLPPNGSFQPSNDMMLKFYSYYKQATVGACNIPRPGFWDAVAEPNGRDAWNSLGNMSKEDAMVSYVNEIKLILEGMPMTIEVEKFLRAIGPFYELVEEKKKISQVSDLSTGLSTTLNSAVTKSIIKTMEMNGSLESSTAGIKAKGGRESVEEDDEAKKKEPTRKQRTSLPNGKVISGESHLSNGSHSRSSLNGQASQDGEPLSNGHHAGEDLAVGSPCDQTSDPSADVSSPSHLPSDSDSEVYCDSVDQLGQEEVRAVSSTQPLELTVVDDSFIHRCQTSEHSRSLDGLDDEESQVLAPVKESGAERRRSDAAEQRFNAEGSSSSAVRRGRGSKSPGLGSGNMEPLHSTGGGDGGRWGGAAKAGGSLNEQIVVALARLQDDMQSVLERLHTLEALTASQVSPQPCLCSQQPSWWPFDISPPTFAFAIVWPFVVQWLIHLYVRRRKRYSC